MRTHPAILGLASAAFGLLSGCPATPPAMPAGAAHDAAAVAAAGATVKELIFGQATVDGPLVGATVRITALDGTPLGTAETHADLTNQAGIFVIPAAESPRDFRLVTTGGTLNGKPFKGELRAEVRGHKANAGYVAVGPVSTIVSVYMAAHPEKSLPDATMAIKTFLAIPASYDIGLDLLHRPAVFDAAGYAAQVDARGGHLAFAKALVAELDAGGKHPIQTARPYHVASEPAPAAPAAGGAQQGPDPSVAMTLGVADLATTAVTGKSVMGIVMDTFGSHGESETQQAFEALYAKLEEIEQKIDDLSSAVTADANLINANVTLGNYDGAARDSILKYADANQYVRNNLLMLAQLKNPVPTGDAQADAQARQDVASDRQYLLDDTSRFIDENYTNFAEQMHGAMVGGTGRSSLIALWSQAINGASPYFYSYETASQMQRWWDFADFIQLDAVRIKLERLRARKVTGLPITNLLGTFQTNRAQQLALLRGVVRPTDALDLSLLGLPVTPVTLKSLPGQWIPEDGGVPGHWSVTIQKRDGANNQRLWLWRATPDSAVSPPPLFKDKHAVQPTSHDPAQDVYGRPDLSQSTISASADYWQKIARSRARADYYSGVPVAGGSAWVPGKLDEVTSLFKLPGGKGPEAYGLVFKGSPPIFTSQIDVRDNDAWEYLDYVDPATGAVSTWRFNYYGASTFHATTFNIFVPNSDPPPPPGNVLLHQPLPINTDTLWYD